MSILKFSNLKSSPAARAASKGFSLIELMVAIAIIGILAGLMTGSFSGDSSKATKLLADMTTIRDSVNRAKLEMGGVPKRLSVLWNRSDAGSANMFNGLDAQKTWNGPYIERQATDTNNAITITTIADAATIHIDREAASASNGGNYAWVYYLRASNIPNPIIDEFMKKCAGTDEARTFLQGSCRATKGSGATEFGTVDIKITDSR